MILYLEHSIQRYSIYNINKEENVDMKGYIHSIDSFGTVDGPGIRMVIFMQGCPLSCGYCHNPDTWKTNIGTVYSVDDILNKYEKTKGFTTGGITVTGGEPLLQIKFLIELFKRFKEKGVNCCVDTSGITFNNENREFFDELMHYTDLVLLDIKHIDSEQHKILTGAGNENILSFAKYLSEIKKDVWIRHVVIESITLNDDYLLRLGSFLSELKNIKALDIIPYHTMAIDKYIKLNISYPLEGIEATSTERTSYALKVILKGIKQQLNIKADKK